VSRVFISSWYAATTAGVLAGGSLERHEKDGDSAISVQLPAEAFEARATNFDRT
jgi:hypothetical protein